MVLRFNSVISSYNLRWSYASYNLPVAYGHACSVTVKWDDNHETVYLIGGYGDNVHLSGYSNQIYYLDSDLQSTTVGNVSITNQMEPPQINCATQSTVYSPSNGIIYLVAGYESKGIVYQLLTNKYNPSHIVWSSNEIPINPGGDGFSCTSFDSDRNMIITFGGQNRNKLWILPLNSSFPEWITKTSASNNVSNHACIVSNDKYWSFGGTINRHSYRTYVFSYDLAQETWNTNHYPLNLGFANGKAVEIDANYGLILVAGGRVYDGSIDGLVSVIPQLYNISMNRPVDILENLGGLTGGYSSSMIEFVMGRVIMLGGWKDKICIDYNCSYTNRIQISNLLFENEIDVDTDTTTKFPTTSMIDNTVSVKVNVTSEGNIDDLDKNDSESYSVMEIVIVMAIVVVVIILSFLFYRWHKKRNELQMINQRLLEEGSNGTDYIEAP